MIVDISGSYEIDGSQYMAIINITVDEHSLDADELAVLKHHSYKPFAAKVVSPTATRYSLRRRFDSEKECKRSLDSLVSFFWRKIEFLK